MPFSSRISVRALVLFVCVRLYLNSGTSAFKFVFVEKNFVIFFNILLFLQYLRTYLKYACKTISTLCLIIYRLKLLMLTFPTVAMTAKSGVSPNWISVLAMSFTNCVIISKIFNFSSPQLPHLKGRGIIIPASSIMRSK